MVQSNMPAEKWVHRKRTVFIALPAFNEEGCIGALLGHIDSAMVDASLSYKVILIDDGSTDRTSAIAEEYSAHMPLILQRHGSNQGLGVTIKDGIMKALELADESDIIITMDADDTHTPGLILRMVRMVSEGYDVVIASRFQREARTIGVPLLRRLLSSGASMILRILFPVKGVRDYTCGFRAYRASILKEAINRYGKDFFDQEGFQCMVDILLKLRGMHLIFGEVPFILRYDFKEGGTKMNIRRTIIKTLSLIVKRRLGK